MKKLAGKLISSSGIEVDDILTKATEMVEAQLPEEVTVIEEINVIAPIVDEVSVEKVDTNSIIDLTTNTAEVLDILENDKEIKTNSLPSSAPTHELPPPSTDIVNISEDTNSIKKNHEEESVKPGNTYILILLGYLTQTIYEGNKSNISFSVKNIF